MTVPGQGGQQEEDQKAESPKRQPGKGSVGSLGFRVPGIRLGRCLWARTRMSWGGTMAVQSPGAELSGAPVGKHSGLRQGELNPEHRLP